MYGNDTSLCDLDQTCNFNLMYLILVLVPALCACLMMAVLLHCRLAKSLMSYCLAYFFRPYSDLQDKLSTMSLSAQTLRPSPYTIPPPRSHRIPYCSNTATAFSSGQLQQQPPYSISYATTPPSHPPGPLSFQGMLPCSSPPSMLPPASTTSIQLPGSPVSLQYCLFQLS